MRTVNWADTLRETVTNLDFSEMLPQASKCGVDRCADLAHVLSYHGKQHNRAVAAGETMIPEEQRFQRS